MTKRSYSMLQDNKGIPQVQRDLQQVEQLSRNLRAKTVRLDAGAETIAATRLLAHEGLNTRKYALAHCFRPVYSQAFHLRNRFALQCTACIDAPSS